MPISTALFFFSVSLAADGNAAAADRACKAGNRLFEEGKHEAALLRYLECLRHVEDHRDALYNGGLAAYLADKFDDAAKLWERLRALEPADTRLLAKLVQAHEARGAAEKREEARKALLAARAALPEEERAHLPRYCREQFQAGKRKVMAFEYFELEGDRAVRYRFSVLDEKGDEAYWISLGSYEMTTEIAREQGEIEKDARMWHLDRYSKEVHALVGMFTFEPTYEEARGKVIEAITGKKPPARGKAKRKGKGKGKGPVSKPGKRRAGEEKGTAGGEGEAPPR